MYMYMHVCVCVYVYVYVCVCFVCDKNIHPYTPHVRVLTHLLVSAAKLECHLCGDMCHIGASGAALRSRNNVRNNVVLPPLKPITGGSGKSGAMLEALPRAKKVRFDIIFSVSVQCTQLVAKHVN